MTSYKSTAIYILLRIWKPCAHKQPESPSFSYFDKYVFIVRIHPLCLMGITCVSYELFYSQVYYILLNINNDDTLTRPGRHYTRVRDHGRERRFRHLTAGSALARWSVRPDQ